MTHCQGREFDLHAFVLRSSLLHSISSLKVCSLQIVLQLGILSTLRRRDLALWLLFKIDFINAVGNTTGEASASTGF